MERCKSGLIGGPGKTVCLYGYRGFESHPLRRQHFLSSDRDIKKRQEGDFLIELRYE